MTQAFKFNRLSENEYNIISDKGFVFTKDEFINAFRYIYDIKQLEGDVYTDAYATVCNKFSGTTSNFSLTKHIVFGNFDIKLVDHRKDEHYFIGYNINDVFEFMNMTQAAFESIKDDRLELFNKFSKELYNIKD